MNSHRFLTPLARARGLGSAHNGTHHWWAQRMTALGLVLLALWLMWSAGHLVGADYQATIAWFHNPLNGVAMILFVGTTFYHLALGLQVVIEDYIHRSCVKLACLLGVKFTCALLGIMAAVSVIKIMLQK